MGTSSFLRRLLSRRDWVYLLSLLVPFIIYDLSLKASDIAWQPESRGFTQILKLTWSDVFFDLGYALLWIGLFAAVQRRGACARVVVVLFHVVTIFIITVTTCETKREYTTLSRKQLAAFFRAAAEAEDRFEALFIVGALAGPRPGELLGLKWEDLKLPETPGEAGEAMIRRSYSATRSGAIMRETTKTGKGRPIFLLPEVVGALRAHRKRQLEERMRYKGLWEENDLVFPSTTGGPMNQRNLNRRHFKPLLAAAGLPDIRPYDLRHTFATLWLESGEHPKILQEILGHSRISLTLDTYSHVVPHMQASAFERFGESFGSISDAP